MKYRSPMNNSMQLRKRGMIMSGEVAPDKPRMSIDDEHVMVGHSVAHIDQFGRVTWFDVPFDLIEVQPNAVVYGDNDGRTTRSRRGFVKHVLRTVRANPNYKFDRILHTAKWVIANEGRIGRSILYAFGVVLVIVFLLRIFWPALYGQ